MISILQPKTRGVSQLPKSSTGMSTFMGSVVVGALHSMLSFGFAILGVLLGASHALVGHVSAAGIPEARWIGPQTSQVNQWTRYHHRFDLAEKPSSARAVIAVDSKYWLWINGQIVVREGGLKRGPTPDSTYQDVLELASFLRKGSNSIAILVWHFGQDGFSHHCPGLSGLLFSMELPSQAVGSDASWMMSPHPAIGTSPDTPPNRRLPESSLTFDARLDDEAWTKADFSPDGWLTPADHGPAGSQPWGKLVERPIPQWKDYGIREYAELRRSGDLVIAKLPYNAQVHPWMEIEATAGLEIDIRTDNFMGGSEPNVHAKYVTRDGVQQFECLGWMNGHEVHYKFPRGIKVRALKFRETGYDTEFTGRFRCDDPDLNLLWTKAARTLYVTMRDTYMDCPDRERAQWWGDVVNELGEVAYALDPRANHLTKKAILELVDWRRPDGSLYSPVPAGLPEDGSRKDSGGRHWYTELPVQMLASVGKYGLWTYYLNTGDIDTIRHAYPAVRDYLKIWKLDDDDLVIHRPGDWDWSDWGNEIDVRILDSAWYQLALEGAIEMAKVTGNEDDIQGWMDLREKISGGFNRIFWTGAEYRSPGYRGDTDDRANALAVLAGFARPTQYGALRKVLARHRNASPWMEKYVLEALFIMDDPDLALSRMEERYRAQIDSPLTTLWEGWGIGGEGFGGGSYNHAWSGGPLTCLSQFVAGVSPTSPGYKTFEIRPQMGRLRLVEADVDSPQGMIRLKIEREDLLFKAQGVIPEGSRGRIGIPGQGADPKFLVNGESRNPTEVTGVFHFFDLGPGEFLIESER